MKLNEFLLMNYLELKIYVCPCGEYRVDFEPLVEISDGICLKSCCGDASKNLNQAIQNTLNNISYKKLKIDNKHYINILDVEL